MWYTVNSDLIEEVWRALNASNIPPRLTTIAQLSKRMVEQGWADICDIQDVLWAMDGRFADRHAGELARAFGVPLRPIYQRPTNRVRTCFGMQSMATTDVANFLIMIERLGFEIDPSALVTTLAERLKKVSHFNDAELSIHWYQKNRHKQSPLTLVVNEKSIGEKHRELRTRSNYRVEIWRNSVGTATMLQSFAPSFRARRKNSAGAWSWAA